MAVQYPLAVVLGLIDKLSGPWGKALGRLGGGARVLNNVGKALRTNVTLPLIGIGAASIIASTTFGASLNRTQAASGATADEMARARSEITQTARDLKATPRSAAEALHALVEEGQALPDALDATRHALMLANVAQMEVAASASLLDDVLDAYGQQAGGAGAAADILARGSRVAGESIEGFGGALLTVGPIARALGVPLLTVAKMTAALTDNGFKAGDAATGLRAAMVGLTRAGAANADGTLDVVTQLERMAAAGVTGEQLVTKFGKSAGPVLSTLLRVGANGLDTYGQRLDEVKSLTEQNAIVNQGEVGAAKDLASAWSLLLIKAGEGGLITALTAMTERLIPLLDMFNSASPKTLQWGVALGVVAAALGPLAIAIAAIATPVGLVVGGVAAAVAAGWWLYQNWDMVADALSGTFKYIGAGFSWLWQWILRGVQWLEDLLPDWLHDRLFGKGEVTVGGGASVPTAPVAGGPPAREGVSDVLGVQRQESTVDIRLHDFPPNTRVQTSGEVDLKTDLGLAMIGSGT